MRTRSGRDGEPNRRVSRTGVRFLLLFLIATSTGCGIGQLEKDDKGPKARAVSSQISAVNAANKSRTSAINVAPRGGPGTGAPAATKAPNAKSREKKDSTAVRAARVARDSAHAPGWRRRFAAWIRGRDLEPAAARTPPPPVNKDEISEPGITRGTYAMEEGADFFIPCGDTARYQLRGTSEALYLMRLRMRFIVRGARTPAYAVVFARTIITRPVPTAAEGAEPEAAAPATPTKRVVFIMRFDSLTTTFPARCPSALLRQ